MQKQSFQLNTSDQVKLQGFHWAVDNPKAVICLVHGFGEHADRYNHFAKWFNDKGFSVVAYDRRGHGKSEGQRGHTPSYAAYLDEIDLLINKSKALYPGKEYLLYGHSQGGNIVLNYVLDKKPDTKCAIVTGPWIQLAFEPNKFLVGLGKVMKKVYPKFSNKNELDPSTVSSDPAVVQAYIDDPLVHDKITANTGIEMMQSADKLNNFKGNMPVPTLIMHGTGDKVTSMPASKSFAERVGGDITLKLWDDMYHEIHNELGQKEVFEYTFNWLDGKL